MWISKNSFLFDETPIKPNVVGGDAAYIRSVLRSQNVLDEVYLREDIERAHDDLDSGMAYEFHTINDLKLFTRASLGLNLNGSIRGICHQNEAITPNIED